MWILLEVIDVIVRLDTLEATVKQVKNDYDTKVYTVNTISKKTNFNVQR